MSTSVSKVKDYPHLIKQSGSIVNTNRDEYLKRKAKQRESKRIAELSKKNQEMERKVDELSDKMDIIIGLLMGDKQ